MSTGPFVALTPVMCELLGAASLDERTLITLSCSANASANAVDRSQGARAEFEGEE